MSHLPLGPGREFDRIRAIERALGAHAASLGDDCALIGPFPHRVVLSTDVSVEDTHFRRAWLASEEIGWRATAAALSDLAAEGAEVVGILVALTAPVGLGEAEMTAIMRGAGDAVTAVGGRVLGGDLARGPSLAIAVTVVGRAVRPVTRRGARPGDALWITGVLGGARAALQAWEAGREPGLECRRAFAHPVPRIAAGRLFSHVGASALIDLSDGLAGDARHLAAASGVRLEIDLALVPLGAGVREAAAAAGQEPEAFAAEGGEDYELLAAVPPEAEPMLRELAARAEAPLTRIGRVVAGEGVRLAVGARELPLGSYDHFA